MEFSHLILIEISFYSNIIYMSTDDGDILNFTNQFHEYLLEQRSKFTFSIFDFQLFGGKNIIIFFQTTLVYFT